MTEWPSPWKETLNGKKGRTPWEPSRKVGLRDASATLLPVFRGSIVIQCFLLKDNVAINISNTSFLPLSHILF